MQAYLNFIDKIEPLIEKAAAETKFQLGLEICKKLYPDFAAFSEKQSFGDTALLSETIESCEKWFKEKSAPKEQIEDVISKLESITPDGEKYNNWEASYAANACEAVIHLLKYLLTFSDKHISEICSLMIDTTDFKIAAENEHLSDDGIFKHPEMLKVMEEMVGRL